MVDGPDEVVTPILWTEPISIGRYQVHPRKAVVDDDALDFAINLPTHGAYLRGLGKRAQVVDASQVVSFARGTGSRNTAVGPTHGGLYLRLAPAVVDALTDAGVEGAWTAQGPVTAGIRRRWVALCRAAHQGLSQEALYEHGLVLTTEVLAALGARSPPVAPGTPARVREVQLWIQAHPESPATLDQLGDAVGWSRFQLCRAFARCTGTTVHALRESVRIGLALERLRDPRCDLASLGLALGYSSHSHFTARFRACTGTTPVQWRRSTNVAARI